MAKNKLVIRYLDGNVAKGFTADFLPAKEIFHFMPLGEAGGLATPVYIKACKALFFVKDFTGNPGYQDVKEIGPVPPVSGRKIQVLFKDNEVLVGTTHGYDPSRQGFFVFSADPRSNYERSYVVAEATSRVDLL